MNLNPAARRARLRPDLQVFRRCSGNSGTSDTICVLHNPISGTAARLDHSSFQRFCNGDVRSEDPLAIDAGAHQLLLNQGGGISSPDKAAHWWSNPLYVRLPGIPADDMAKFIARHGGWLFAGPIVTCWCFCFLLTFCLLINRSSELWNSLPALASFQAKHWGLAVSILALTKVIHELAHAAVCRRMGAPCRQLGVLFLCGTPCLYCDVSESWRIGSPLRRAAVMMAGIYIELILATIAAWIWLASDPSSIRLLSLHVMMVCGVSTVVFNANPLMRYDGYFVLSDLLNVTNLRSRASRAWNAVVFYPLAGIGSRAIQFDNRDLSRSLIISLVSYHALAGIYRYIVIAGLVGWFYFVSTRCGLEPVGRVLVVVAVALVLLGWLRRWARMMVGIEIWQRVSFLRRMLFGAISAATLSAALFTPWDRRVTIFGTVDYASSSSVYVPTDALVQTVFVDYGDSVNRGDPIVQFDAADLQLERPQLVSRVSQLQLKLDSLRSLAAIEPELLEQVSTTEVRLQAARQQLLRLEDQLRALVVRAPVAGTIVRTLSDSEDRSLPICLRERIASSRLEGDLWCRVGKEDSKQVKLSVEASHRASIAVGKQVNLCVPTLGSRRAGGVIACEVHEISDANVDLSIDPTVSSQDRFEILCRLPASFAASVPVGAKVRGVFKGDATTLFDLLSNRLQGWIQ